MLGLRGGGGGGEGVEMYNRKMADIMSMYRICVESSVGGS